MMLTSATDRAFLEAVILDPDDDTHRLVFADWLDEHDDPRAEFIRLQCDLESLAADDPRYAAIAAREQDFRHRHGREWAGALARLVSHYEFRRGFVERVRLDGKSMLANASVVFRLAPIRELELRANADELSRLTEYPYFSRLRTLGLTYHGQDGEALADFFDSPHLAGLTSLRVRSSGTSSSSALVGARHLSNLTDLDLGPSAGPNAVANLIEARSLTGLSRLCLNSAGIDDEAAYLLASSSFMASLSAIDLRYNRLQADGAVALARSPHANRLATLALGYNHIGDQGFAALASSSHLGSLTRLYLSHNGLHGRSLKGLASSPLGARLTHLDLDYNDLSTESLAELAAAPRLNRLQTLFLRCGAGVTGDIRRRLIRRFGEHVCSF